MALTFEQAFPVLYKGWDPASAKADFNAGGWKNKAGAEQFLGTSQSTSSTPVVSQSPQQSVDQLVKDSFQKLQTEANQKFKDYRANNPFNFDDVLAQKTNQAKEQLDPYYNETLSDYLLGVSRKTQRSQADTRDLLGELTATTDSYNRDTQLKLSETINKAKQGFADTGLFDSGARFREGEGLPTTLAQNDLSDFTRRQDLRANQANTGLSRTMEDLALGQKQDVRNIERDRYTNESTLAGQLTKETGQQYVSGFNQTLPPQLQANNNFDLLKQIGIYS